MWPHYITKKTKQKPLDFIKRFYKKLAPRVGFEPTTTRLTAGCSTVELSRNKHRPGDYLLFQGVAPQVPSAPKSLTTVFGMGTGVASSLASPGKIKLIHQRSKKISENHIEEKQKNKAKESRSNPRPISTSQLKTSLSLHTWPINQIILLESYQLMLWEISS